MHQCSFTKLLTRPVQSLCTVYGMQGRVCDAFLAWRVRTAGCLHDVCVIVIRRAKHPNHWNPSCCMQHHTVTTRSPCMLLTASVKCSSGPWPYDLFVPSSLGADAFLSFAISNYFALSKASSASTRRVHADLLHAKRFHLRLLF